MPRQDPQPLIRRGQLPQPPRLNRVLRPTTEGSVEDIKAWRQEMTSYLEHLTAALENTRLPFAPKAEVYLEADQATTTALAAIAWEATSYDNGGWWSSGNASRLTAPLGGVVAGVFQTKLSGSGTVRVQLAVNGTDDERGMDVTLNGDFTFAFPFELYLNEADYLEVKASTGSSRNLLATWTKVSVHHADFLEEV